jgi:hypothetical protein
MASRPPGSGMPLSSGRPGGSAGVVKPSRARARGSFRQARHDVSVPAWALSIPRVAWSVLSGGWRRLRKRTLDRHALVREGSEVLTPVIEYIRKIGPPAAAVGTAEQVAERLQSNEDRWEELRPPLRVYANQHPSPNVPERTKRLVEAVNDSLRATYVLAYGIFQSSGADVVEAHREAQAKQAEAQAAAEALLREIRKF